MQQPLIHIHAWWNLVSMLSCWVAKRKGVPVVLSPRGMLTGYTLGNRNALFKKVLHALLGKSLLAYCDIHATSEKERKDIEQHFKVKSVTVIPNFVELPDELPKRAPQDPDVLKLVFLSRIEQKKGLELLFDALAAIDFPWTLQLAGTGDATYIESLKRKAESLGLTDRISWLGHVGNADKFQLLANNDLLVLTSYNENFANVVIESLAVGTPVLVSEEVGLADDVKQHGLGWVCSLEQDAIIEQLTIAYTELKAPNHYVERTKEAVSKHFNASQLREQYVLFYQKATIN